MTLASPEGSRFALGASPLGPGVHRFAHEAMATTFEVYCVHDDRSYAGQAAHAAFALVDRLEQELSRFIPNSDVSRINELTAGQATRVGPSALECLQIARHLYDFTGGAFDISIGSGLEHLGLVPGDFTVHAEADGVHLDLGGIGKGYAVDRMAEILEDWGIDRALVHGGFSSVLALEAPPDHEGWPLTLSAPGRGDHRVLARLSARHRAFSASGVTKGEHIRDPRTGLALSGRAAAWVGIPRQAAASAAAVADGLSTAFMIQPTEEIAELCRNHPGLEVWLVPETLEGDPALVHLATSP